MDLTRNAVQAVDRLPRHAVVPACVAGALAIAALDAVTGGRVAMTLFYLLPLSVAAWAGGKKMGSLFAVGIAGLWYAADALSFGEWSSTTAIWNGVVRFAVLFLAAQVIATLHETIDEQRLLARRDERTGLANAREFMERAGVELKRVARFGSPLTVAYCDVDDLKVVNDTDGHEAGDRLLAAIAGALRSSLRASDMVARMGGDEFALLLPGTGEEDAWTALMKIIENTEGLSTQGRRVTVSIGAVWTCLRSDDVEGLLREADTCLYMVKGAGKDGLLLAAAGDTPDARAIRHRRP